MNPNDGRRPSRPLSATAIKTRCRVEEPGPGAKVDIAGPTEPLREPKDVTGGLLAANSDADRALDVARVSAELYFECVDQPAATVTVAAIILTSLVASVSNSPPVIARGCPILSVDVHTCGEGRGYVVDMIIDSGLPYNAILTLSSGACCCRRCFASSGDYLCKRSCNLRYAGPLSIKFTAEVGVVCFQGVNSPCGLRKVA